MERTYVSYRIIDPAKIKRQMLSWASRFNICCFLDNQAYALPSHAVECLLGVGAVASLRAQAGVAFDQLRDFTADRRDWLFGHFGYDLAAETVDFHRQMGAQSNEREPQPDERGSQANVMDPQPKEDTRPNQRGSQANVTDPQPDETSVSDLAEQGASRPDPIGFPDLFFFVPKVVVELKENVVRIGSFGGHEKIWEEILNVAEATLASSHMDGRQAAINRAFQARFSRDEYLDAVAGLKARILRGDCYEINFCQEFYAQPAKIHPVQTWCALSAVSPNPFSAFYRLDDQYLLCASPERYLQRRGDVVISQPIKGTSPRFPDDPAADKASREELYTSAKDRSENVMVVDLVRNDLSRICRTDSVRVSELFGIYSFPHVHQMVSTVEGVLKPGIGLAEAIKATFPMGSMTGAPKSRVVELIGQYERSRRGLFSGAVGYVTPSGDFDFNVVIRSLLYNQATHYLSYLVGSGITFYSDPVLEYEECLMKAAGIKKALQIPEGHE